MPSKVEALGIFLILLPGFTCAYVSQYLSVRRKQTELDKVVEALLFSVRRFARFKVGAADWTVAQTKPAAEEPTA